MKKKMSEGGSAALLFSLRRFFYPFPTTRGGASLAPGYAQAALQAAENAYGVWTFAVVSAPLEPPTKVAAPIDLL